MRRALTAAIASAALIGSSMLVAPAAQADGPVPNTQFGMHIPAIAQGENPAAPIGTVRLWDSGVAWGQVQQKKNKWWWNGLDGAIQQANAQNMQILYVLGSTPKWAQKKAPKGNYPYNGTGAANPSSKDWKNWVTAVVKRHGNSIDSYQIWNEANLTDFYKGTPKQMAQLTRDAYRIIKRYDPTATVVAASSTVRLQSRYKKFFPKYLKELKKMKWPVDAISVHTYPDGNGTPEDRVKYIDQVKKDMRKAKVPASKQLWDTEVNYGIKGPGKIKGQTISGGQAADWTAATYLDSIIKGVDRTYWYYWYRPDGRLGIILQDGTPGALGYQTVYNWMNGAFYTCTEGVPNVCQLGDANDPATVVWSNSGFGTYTVPANATVMCNSLNQCSPVAPGTPMTIGINPTWFGSDARNAANQAEWAQQAALAAAPPVESAAPPAQ